MSALGQIVALAAGKGQRPAKAAKPGGRVRQQSFLRGVVLAFTLVETGSLTSSEVRSITGVSRTAGKRYLSLLATMPGVEATWENAEHGGQRRVLRYATPPQD